MKWRADTDSPSGKLTFIYLFLTLLLTSNLTLKALKVYLEKKKEKYFLDVPRQPWQSDTSQYNGITVTLILHHTHTHTHYIHTVALSYSCIPLSVSTSLSCSFAQRCSHIPSHVHLLKDTLLTHPHNASNPSFISPPPPPPTLSACDLPLGSMSWSGLKELVPCIQSAHFSQTCMWAGELLGEDSLRVLSVHLRSGQTRLSAHCYSDSAECIFEPIFLSSFGAVIPAD